MQWRTVYGCACRMSDELEQYDVLRQEREVTFLERETALLQASLRHPAVRAMTASSVHKLPAQIGAVNLRSDFTRMSRVVCLSERLSVNCLLLAWEMGFVNTLRRTCSGCSAVTKRCAGLKITRGQRHGALTVWAGKLQQKFVTSPA